MNTFMNSSPAPSPCVNICVMDEATGWCTGCFRTIDEIVAWGTARNIDKWSILESLEAREVAYFKGVV
jgi:uncharacterized protein